MPDTAVEKSWMKIIPEEDRAVYKRFQNAAPTLGERAGLVLVDITYGFTGRKGLTLEQAVAEYAGACGPASWEAMPRVAQLIGLFRERKLPIVYTRMALSQLPFVSTVSRTRDWGAGFNDFPPEIAPIDDEWVLEKTKASGFFQTPLSTHFVRERVDTVVVCGVSTSGCVRATAVDAASHGFKTLVVDDCSFDRSWFAHCASMFDLNAKYARAVSLHELEPLMPAVRRNAAA